MRLIDYQEKELWRGTIFRLKGKYPFESIVDFMLIYYPPVDSNFIICCISGYCAGHVELYLPKEAKNLSSCSISTQWMVENWNNWIYPDCPVGDVLVLNAQVPSEYNNL